MAKGPGRANRVGLSWTDLFRMIPDEDTAEAWWVQSRWPHGVVCPGCGSLRIQDRTTRKPQPYRCRDCRKDFSAKTGLADAELAAPLPDVGDRHLHPDDRHQGHVVDEAPPRPQGDPEDRLVLGAPHPRDLGRELWRPVHRAGRGRRDVDRRQDEEYAPEEAAGARARSLEQDRRGRRHRPADQEDRGRGGRPDRRGDADRVREAGGAADPDGLHRRGGGVSEPTEPRDGPPRHRRVRQRPSPTATASKASGAS